MKWTAFQEEEAMTRNKFSLFGIVYRSPIIYNLLTFLKKGPAHRKRFRIIRDYIDQGGSILDVCAGDGTMRRYLMENCKYLAVDASRGFIQALRKKGLDCFYADLHQGLPLAENSYDNVIMLISLYEFRDSSLNSLLDDCKRIAAKKVIILEEVLSGDTRYESLFARRVRKYLCATEYQVTSRLFTFEEFKECLKSHGFEIIRWENPYAVGIYKKV